MNIQISKCDPYREKFLFTERVIRDDSVTPVHQGCVPVTIIILTASKEGVFER